MAPLVGVRVSPPTVQLSVRQVLDGTFQRAADPCVGDHVVQRPAIVRAYNELQWQGFGTSVMSNRSLLRAPGGALYDEGYILAYCGINSATNVPGLPAFAHRLRAAQDWFTPAQPPGRLRLAAVNDSFFTYIPIALLEQGRIFRSEAMYEYLTLNQFHYENGHIERVRHDNAEILRNLLDADVVLPEEVESRVDGPTASMFLDMVQAEMAREKREGVGR